MNRKIKHARAAKLFRALYLLFLLSKLIKLIKFDPTFDLKNTPKTLKNNAFFTKWSGADLLLPLVGRPQNPRCKISYPPPNNGSDHFWLKMMENQEGNERPTSTVIGGGAVSFLKIYMFSHVLRLKHVISGFEFDRLRRSSQIHCLPGMHRGFCDRPKVRSSCSKISFFHE